MTQPPPALTGFTEYTFSHNGYSHQVFTAGSGPAVVLIHEIPGLHPGVVDLARRLVDRGFRVYLPSLFGTPGADVTTGAMLRTIGRICVSKEFRGLTRQPAGATGWLRALVRQAWADGAGMAGVGTAGAGADGGDPGRGAGVGVIGMCLTGGFALATALEPAVLAAVLSQPALPLPLGAGRASIGLAPQDIDTLKARTIDGPAGLGILGLRFTDDRGCPPERFQTLRTEFGAGFESIEIDSSPGNAAGIPSSAHCVLTVSLVDEPGHPTRAALERTVEFLAERLIPRPQP
ncbi:dienelactone hydrolase [Cryobacterium lactosi]|uniref:Dienelactone hydrolase n=1 Tax=Cryobacterium lactosi TaxID=1259202 RepID=A0A4R9BM20_9MICO|nr:dienelactone hydrolase family protein [Cryobacterium lactosi]TFD87199.1 dienelactone hydrolase [Cryobacterium lactosi]